MFMLKKVITPFLLPPGILIIVLLFAGLILVFRRKGKAAFFSFIIAILLWAASAAPVSYQLLRGLEADFSMPERPQGDVIILLGGGAYEEVRDLSGIGAPSEEMSSRIITAVRLQKKLGVPVVVSGGRVYEHRKAEAPIVQRILIDLGVPEKKIIVEVKSRDTIENALNTAVICRERGYGTPLLLTSAYHMKRAVAGFERVHMKVTPFPSGFRTGGNKTFAWIDYLPDAGSMKDVSDALREYLGILFNRVFY